MSITRLLIRFRRDLEVLGVSNRSLFICKQASFQDRILTSSALCNPIKYYVVNVCFSLTQKTGVHIFKKRDPGAELGSNDIRYQMVPSPILQNENWVHSYCVLLYIFVSGPDEFYQACSV